MRDLRDDQVAQAPWPYFRQRDAAKRLGVTVEQLNAIATRAPDKLRHVVVQSRKGGVVFLYNCTDVVAIAENNLRRAVATPQQ